MVGMEFIDDSAYIYCTSKKLPSNVGANDNDIIMDLSSFSSQSIWIYINKTLMKFKNLECLKPL